LFQKLTIPLYVLVVKNNTSHATDG